MFNIALYNPAIPQNTGNIARTCAVTSCALHLIKPYGFIISDKLLKRAGLDYWKELKIREYDDFEDFMTKNAGANIYLFTSKGYKNHTTPQYKKGDFLLFGSETAGVPAKIHVALRENRLRIPMVPGGRCLNLSNSVCIALYEALRQTGFEGMN